MNSKTFVSFSQWLILDRATNMATDAATNGRDYLELFWLFITNQRANTKMGPWQYNRAH